MTAVTPTAARLAGGRSGSAKTRRMQLWNAVGLVVAGLFAFPVYWMVHTALLPADALRSIPPTFINLAPTLEHFAGVLADPSFWDAARLSLTAALIAVLLGVSIAFLAAVGIARFRFRARTGLIVAVLVIQMIPGETLFLSQYRMLDGWGLLNTVAGLSIFYVGMVIPVTIWLLKGFVDGIPRELEEAAMLDGCSHVGAFVRITLPLLGPGLVTAGIMAMISVWNEYTLALITLRTDNGTLPLWLQGFQGATQTTDWGGLMAGSTLFALPVVILFMFVQSRMATGLLAGATR